MTTLTRAHVEWATRAPDERFASLAELDSKAYEYRRNAATAKVKTRDLHAVAVDDDVRLQGPTGAQARLTNWGFGQLAKIAEAPAAYLHKLDSKLAADCLNHGLARVMPDKESHLLFNTGAADGINTVRAATSERYSRIWNCDVTSRLCELAAGGTWQPAPAAFDGSRGLYLSDRDMFAFMVDSDRRIFETAPGGGLSRGFFVWNSEVGAASFGITTFYYEYVCGNHRVWGASNVIDTRIRHIGNNVDARAWELVARELRDYADSTVTEDEAAIKRAMTKTLGGTKDEVLDAVFRLNLPGVGKRVAEQAYALAETRVDWYGSPRTVWGFNGALTEIARDLPNASERVAIERASAKIMALSF